MQGMDDEILSMFVEDTREHLADIESCLMDMERDGADIDEELVNKVFRAAHSIKGGAGFLNLRNVRDLAHKLESLLHMVRNREIVPDTRVISALLGGFDRLLTLVENALSSDAEDIGPLLSSLTALAAEHLPGEDRGKATAMIDIRLPDGRVVFTEDALSLEQGVKGGKLLYMVEYDLIHDVHARKKTPLDVIATMESSGLLLDCKMDLPAVGDLDDPIINKIPFFVLFSTIVEPDVISYLFAIDQNRIHLVDVAALLAAPRPPEGFSPAGRPGIDDPVPPPAAGGVIEGGVYGPVVVVAEGSGAMVTVLENLESKNWEDLRQALLSCLPGAGDVKLDLSALDRADLGLLQVLLAAGATLGRQGRRLEHVASAPECLTLVARRAGLEASRPADGGLAALWARG